MKRYAYIALAAALVLSACGNGDAGKDSITAAAETVETNPAVESTEIVESTIESESDSHGQSGSGLEEPQMVYYAPLDIVLSAKYEGEWDDKGPIITADNAILYILDDGYEELKETIEEYNEATWKEVYNMYTEHLEYAKDDIFPEGTEISISREIEIKRADSKVLSFFNAETAYLGGAHGSYYENAEVFDSETGEIVELADVVTDYDAVYEFVKKSLKDNYEEESFFEDYEDWLYEMFYEPDGAMASPLEWVLTMEGLEFRFSPYVLGPWVAGTFEVKMPYSGNEAMFHPEYLCAVEHPIRKLEPDTEFFVDTNEDGIEDTVQFSVTWDEETYYSTITVTRKGEREDGSGFSNTLTQDEIYGWFSEAYLMYSEENIPYLYVDFRMDNDWEKLEMIRLAETDTVKAMEYIGGAGTAIYGNFVSDPNCFALYDRLDILGTYMAYKDYRIGEDGFPASEDEMYRIANIYFEWEYALKSKKDLTVLIYEKGSEEKVEEKLPKGTKFRPYMTDGESVVVMELEDGRYCEIPVEKKEGEYIYYINGISEYDCFEDLPYAG